MKKILFSLFIVVFLANCANQVEEDDRIEQVYNYSSVLYLGAEEDDGSGRADVTGEIKFSKNSIILTGTYNSQSTKDNCSIRTVTYNDDPNELKYRTNKGDFVVKIENDKIQEVSLYTREFVSIYYKEDKTP